MPRNMKRSTSMPGNGRGRFGGSCFSFGGKWPNEVDKLSSSNPFYPAGTHRAVYGESLLDEGRRFDRKKQEALKTGGRQWKSTPGVGTYKTPRCIFAGGSLGTLQDNDDITRHQYYHEPTWRIGTGPKCTYMLEQAGSSWFTPGTGSYKIDPWT